MAENTTVGQRFTQLISHLGISKNAFAASLDKTATVIQHLVDERNKPGFDLLNKVFEVYPNVSKDWLMQGSGPMLMSGASAASAVPAGQKMKEVVQPDVPDSVATPVAIAPASAPEDAVPAATPPEAKTASASVASPLAATTTDRMELQQAASSAAGVSVPATAAADAGWQSALYTQQMAHQLAMAELRNQHLQEQQRLMQQMLDLLQRRV
jgi:hypothetical protein